MISNQANSIAGIVTLRHEYSITLGGVVRGRKMSRSRFYITLESGAKIMIDEGRDATTSLIEEGDVVRVCVDESSDAGTVRPLKPWQRLPDAHVSTIPGATVLKTGTLCDESGINRTSLLVQLSNADVPAILVEPPETEAAIRAMRLLPEPSPQLSGIVVISYDFRHYLRQVIEGEPTITRREILRKCYVIRFNGTPRFIVIDQDGSISDALIEPGDRVAVRISSDPNPTVTVEPITTFRTTARNWISRKLRTYIHF